MGISAFCSGVLVTCVFVNLGLSGPSPAAAAPSTPPPLVRVPTPAPTPSGPAAAAPSVSPAPEEEETPVVAPEGGARPRGGIVRALAAWSRPFVASAWGAGRTRGREALDARLALGFDVAAPEGTSPTPGSPAVGGSQPVDDDGASGRFAAAFLRSTARYRHAPLPTVTVDSDTGTVLVGLTWKR